MHASTPTRFLARAIVLLSAATGCRSGSAPTAPPGAGGATGSAVAAAHPPSPPKRAPERDGGAASAGADAGIAASPEERAAAKRLESARCHKKSCCATEIWPVGRDRKGRQLAVVALETNRSCLLPQERRSRAASHEDEGDDEHACGEYWLVDVNAPKRPGLAELGRQCESDSWDTNTSIDEKQMTFGYGGKSVNARAETSDWTTIGLDPVRLVSVKHTSTAGQQDRSETWSSD